MFSFIFDTTLPERKCKALYILLSILSKASPRDSHILGWPSLFVLIWIQIFMTHYHFLSFILSLLKINLMKINKNMQICQNIGLAKFKLIIITVIKFWIHRLFLNTVKPNFDLCGIIESSTQCSLCIDMHLHRVVKVLVWHIVCYTGDISLCLAKLSDNLKGCLGSIKGCS